MSTPFKFKNADNTTVDFEDYYVRADYFRSGNLWNWGDNAKGQLGDNTIISKSSPVQTIAWGSNWKQVSCGYYLGSATAAIKADGTLWTWGDNAYGALGDNTIVRKSSPIQTIAFGTNWKQVSSVRGNMAAIKTDGTLWCWGYNSYGELGDNTTVKKSSPIQTVAGGTNWSQVDVGWLNTAAIKTDGTLWIWGDNSQGQLGDNTIVRKSSPVQTVAGGTNWKQVSCSKFRTFTAAIKTDGTLWTWGSNSYGQLGDNTTASKSSPIQTIAGGTNWKQISVGFHAAAIKTDGTLWLWGRNGYGQLGWWGGGSPATDGYAGTSPVTVSGSSSSFNTFTTSNTTGVSVGMKVYTSSTAVDWTTVSAISTNVSITFAEYDFNGNWTGTISLGVGATKATPIIADSTINTSSPVQTVAYGTNWKQVAGSSNHTAAIKTDGTLWCWGYNGDAQLGDNTKINRSSPVQTIAGGTNWKQVSANRANTAAIQYQDDYQ
jgi:hypothetical protein